MYDGFQRYWQLLPVLSQQSYLSKKICFIKVINDLFLFKKARSFKERLSTILPLNNQAMIILKLVFLQINIDKRNIFNTTKWKFRFCSDISHLTLYDPNIYRRYPWSVF